MQKRFCLFFVIKVKKKEFLAKMNNCETKIAKNIKREFISGDKNSCAKSCGCQIEYENRERFVKE